jgi:SAM-dependent methyltransferase
MLIPSGAGEQKLGQASFFDHETNAEREIRRPFGEPAFHRFLLEEKFRRAICALRPLAGSTALVVCGGSGMDAHFLALSGAKVVTSDVSLGAAKRARMRAERFGLAVTSIVADAERLPFVDRSFDVAYVHDGLHHLERPDAALGEMARVARHAISVSEPASAAITSAAVRLGLALDREDAGNTVGRLRLGEVAQTLEGAGFRIVYAHRYAMIYRHEPSAVTRALSYGPMFAAGRVGLAVVNALVGRAGNKLAVQAIREGSVG